MSLGHAQDRILGTLCGSNAFLARAGAALPAMLACLAAGACLSLCACHDKAPAAKPRSLAFTVQVAPVEASDVDYELSAIGSIEAYERVAVSARVAGVIERVLFTEGDAVHKGQVLAEIDMARYVLAVRAAQAALERSTASRAEAEAGLARRQDAMEGTPGIIAGEEIEQWRTKVASLTAEEREKHVALDQAQLNLNQARVRAPTTGVVQSRDAHTGQYAQAGTLLATLLQQDPLLLRFRVPESEATHVNPNMTVNFAVRHGRETGSAQIIHVAAAAGEASRMVEVAAKVIPKKGMHFRPGAFAEVSIPVESHGDAAVVPASAVRPSEKGFLAYVVEDHHAKERRLTLGMRTPDGKVEVKDGIAPGERLVIRGADALQDGVEVRIDKGPPVEVGEADQPPGREEATP